MEAEFGRGVGMEEATQSLCFAGHVSHCATEPDSHDLKSRVSDAI